MRKKIPFRESAEFNLYNQNPIALIKAFRNNRLKQIKSNYDNFNSKPTLVVHVICNDRFFDENYAPIGDIKDVAEKLKPLSDIAGNKNRRNFDGYCIQDFDNDNNLNSYIQVGRDSWIEAVDTSILDKPIDKRQALLKERISTFLGSCITYLSNDDPALTLSLLISMMNVDDFKIRNHEDGKGDIYSIDREYLIFPVMSIETQNINLDSTLAPFYEQLAYASGWGKYQ
jgi:hypothetical protein